MTEFSTVWLEMLRAAGPSPRQACLTFYMVARGSERVEVGTVSPLKFAVTSAALYLSN